MAEYCDIGLQEVFVDPSDRDAAWQNIRNFCPYLTAWDIQTLREGLDSVLRSVIVEQRYVCRDYRDLHSKFYSRKFMDRPSWCTRLHFFSREGVTVNALVLHAEEAKLTDSYIGYAVVQPVKGRSLGRTVLDPARLGKKDFCCLKTPMKVHLAGAELTVSGYPYMAQSGESTVCSHAALWGMCRHLSERYRAYAEVHPYDLIEMAASTSGRRVPYRGLSYSDYCEILSSFGCYPVVLTPRGTDQSDWTKDRETFYDIYAFVESGFPVLASFRKHAATLIGHTPGVELGPKAQREARKQHGQIVDTGFYNSFELMRQLVVVDDNRFPYQLLGYHGDPDNYGDKLQIESAKPCIEAIYAAIVPLPEKAFLLPSIAREMGYEYFAAEYVKGLLDNARKELAVGDDPMIARTFLTSSISFRARKRTFIRPGKGGKALDKGWGPVVEMHLPHFIWVMELSPLSRYRQGQCIAEVVIDASTSKAEAGYIYARVGGTLLIGDEDDPKSSGLTAYPQYTHNLGEKP